MVITILFRKYISTWLSIDEKLVVFMIFSFYGTISFGNLIIFNTGDNNVVTNSIIPELFNNPIAKNI